MSWGGRLAIGALLLAVACGADSPPRVSRVLRDGGGDVMAPERGGTQTELRDQVDLVEFRLDADGSKLHLQWVGTADVALRERRVWMARAWRDRKALFTIMVFGTTALACDGAGDQCSTKLEDAEVHLTPRGVIADIPRSAVDKVDEEVLWAAAAHAQEADDPASAWSDVVPDEAGRRLEAEPSASRQ